MSLRIRLRNCKRSLGEANEPSNANEEDRRKKNNAIHSKQWRVRLKQYPTMHASFKALEAQRAREYRRNRSAAAKESEKENNRERQRKFRAKMKLKQSQNSEQTPPSKKRKVLTRNERMKKREYDRLKKREEREKMSAQKKRRVRERDAARKREKRNKCRNKKKLPTGSGSNCSGSGYKTRSARRMALSRIRKRIPSDPEKFADIVVDFVERCSPRKRSALSARGFNTTRRRIDFEDQCHEKLRSTIACLKKKRDTASLEKRRLLVKGLLVAKKYRMQRMIAQRFHLRPAYLSKLHKSENPSIEGIRKRRSDATCLDVVNNITAFYRNPKVSRELPYMKSVKKQEQRFLMEVSLQKAYELWKLENPETNIVSFQVFSRLRPSSVLLQRHTALNQCLCEYCTGVLLKLQSLNRILRATGKDVCEMLKVKDKYEIISLSLCPKSENDKYHDIKCINRTCSDCGVHLLEERYRMVVDSYGEQVVSWQKWENQVYTHDGKQKTKKVQLTKSDTFKAMFDELLAETEILAKHLFVANWQHDQYSLICEKLPDTWSVFVLDFAENYSCLSQDEIQSAHWSIQQVTVHPIVCFYKCPREGHDHTVQEALVFLSDDLTHDANAVHHFETIAIKHLKEKQELKLEHVVEFSDGCSSQYKSRVPFAYISNSQFSHGVSLERCYFGSRHGKGPSDGVSGVVKSSVRRAVMSRRTTVNSAKDMYDFCNLNMTKDCCDGQLRSFHLVNRGEIQRDCPITQVKSSLAGTRVLHSVRGVSPGVLDTRLFSCFCDGCMQHSDGSHCTNTAYILPWQRRTLNLSPEIVDMYQPEVVVQNETSKDADEPTQVPTEQAKDLLMKLSNPVLVDETTEENEGQSELCGSTEVISEGLISILDLSADTLDLILSEDHAQGVETGSSEQQNKLNLELMKDYAVLYTSPPKWYLGRVIDLPSEEGVPMKFLEQKGVTNSFSWPRTEDIETIDPLYIFHGPINLIGHHSFSVAEEEFQAIDEMYQEIRKNKH